MMRPWSSWVRAAVLGPAILLSSVALGGTQAEDPLEVEPAVIRAVRYHVEPARTRVWFETSGTLFYTHYSPDPLTLVIDLPGVDITAISDRIVVGSQEVESIVATRLDGGGDKSLSRIEIKLSSLVPYQILATEHALTVLFEGAGSPAEAPPIAVVPLAVPTDTTTTSASTDDIVDTDDAVATETVESEPTTEPAEQRPVSAPSVPVRSATSVDSVSHTVAEGLLTVTVGANGRLNYTSFRLADPPRLVFDFAATVNRVPRQRVPIDAAGVYRARVAQFQSANPKITRIVFDLARQVHHRALSEGSDLKIYFSVSADQIADPSRFP